MQKAIDVPKGTRFGYWEVVEYEGFSEKRHNQILLCKCVCGTLRGISFPELSSGRSKSCGCKRGEHVSANRNTHNMSNTRLYSIWRSMKGRCYYKAHKAYDNYGGRGITVCSEWRDNFEAFHDWAMANGYADNLTLDRRDNDKGYSPDNCRWATRIEQMRNRTITVFIEYKGKAKTIPEWAEELGMEAKTLYCRYDRGIRPPELFKQKNLGTNRKLYTNYKIIQRLNNGDIVTTYESAKLAAMAIGGKSNGIRNACSGYRKTYKGYIWQYSETANIKTTGRETIVAAQEKELRVTA